MKNNYSLSQYLQNHYFKRDNFSTLQEMLYTVAEKYSDKTAFVLKDKAGYTYNVSSNPDMQNILAREMNYNMKPQSILVPASQGYVKVSSYVTLHQLEDGVLNFDKNFAGRYDGQWNTPAKARKFVAKYKLRK